MSTSTTMAQATVHTIRYRSSRREIWKAYWRAWAKPRGLWRYHVVIGFLIAATYFEVRHYSNLTVASFFLAALAGTLGCLTVFSLWPQIRFKSSERVLSVDPSGWKTTIGKLSGARSWREVQEIAELPNAIYIVGVNKNALVIPARAFADKENRNQFLADVRRWHESAGKQ